MQPTKEQTLSLIVPVYNEQNSIPLFLESVTPTLDTTSLNYEIIFINDGSQDLTWEVLLKQAEKNPQIKLLNLSRNFGKEIALTAGLQHASGDAAIPIDCDLQDPPELIPAMLEKWQEGYDVVLAKRKSRSHDSRTKRWSASLYYKILSLLSETDIPQNVGDFRLIDKKVLRVLNQYPERARFMKGIFASLGFKEYVLEFERPDRAEGQAKQNYYKLYQLAVEGIVSFTSIPLKLWSFLGVTIAFLSLTYGLYLIFKTMILGVDVPGYASIMVVQLFMSGIILLSLGVIGEYLSRIFTEVKARPLYIVMEQVGFPDNKTEIAAEKN